MQKNKNKNENWLKNHLERAGLTELRKLPVMLPTKLVISKFKSMVESTLVTISLNNIQIQSLQKTRDTLLPKLLSGELDVSELELEVQ